MIKTDIKQFTKFHECLTKDHPEYTPFYFPLNQNSKDPFEGISWKQNRATFETACKYLGMGYNIGIAATDKDKLVLMDKDDIVAVGLTKPTLTTVSRKRFGEHGFYFTDDKVTSDIFENSAKQNIATDTYGEIRANWQYVVCAGSFVPVDPNELDDDGIKIWDKIPDNEKINAGKYTVRDASPVNTITYDELPPIFIKCLTGKREDDLSKRLSSVKKENQPIQNDKNKSALFNLSIEDVTGKMENGGQRFPSLFHGSATGANSSIKDGLFHCWRHSVSHSPLTALAVIAGMGECSRLGFAHHGRGSSVLGLKDGETQFKLWDYAKKTGLIPQDDPIPSKALVWFARHHKICDEQAIIDGWKLPTNFYNEAIEKLSELKTNPGRKTITNKSYNQTDMGNAQRLVDKFGKIIRYSHPQKSWFFWNGKIWEKDETAEIERKAKDTVKKIYRDAIEIEDPDKRKDALSFAMKCESQARRKSMIETATSETGIPILPTDFDKETMLFNVQNGTIDLQTGKITPQERTNYLTKISPIKYDPAAKCPIWNMFLSEIFEGKTDLIAYMQRQAGYYLTGETKEEDFSIYYGTGGNGKSKYINQIMYVLGDYALKVNVETLLESKSQKSSGSASGDVARMKGVRLVMASEPEFGAELKEGLIKDLTGREKITARFLYEDDITFDPTFKIVLLTNHRVNIKGQDKGIWRRVKETPFTVTIPEEKIDLDLDIKLKAESSGILNWMLEGCKQWQEKGMQVPKEVIDATLEYKEDMDVLGEFLKLCCVVDKKLVTPNRWLYNWTYIPYCEVMGIRPWRQKTFSESLRDREGGFKSKHGRNGNSWINLGLNLHLSQKLSRVETDAANGFVTDVRDLTHFMQTFLSNPSYRNFIDNTSHPSLPFTEDSNNKEAEVKISGVKDESVTDGDVKGKFVAPKIILEKNFKMLEVNDNTEQTRITAIAMKEEIGIKAQLPAITELLMKAKQRYEHEKGVINSANITLFSIWMCDQFKPQWQQGTETGYYTPSAIKGLASKLFGLTPTIPKLSQA